MTPEEAKEMLLTERRKAEADAKAEIEAVCAKYGVRLVPWINIRGDRIGTGVDVEQL